MQKTMWLFVFLAGFMLGWAGDAFLPLHNVNGERSVVAASKPAVEAGPKPDRAVAGTVSAPNATNPNTPTRDGNAASGPADRHDILLELLQDGRYQVAVAYAQHHKLPPGLIRDFAHQLMDAGQLGNCIRLMNIYKDEYVTDIEGMEILATAYERNNQTMTAIRTLNQAKGSTAYWDVKNRIIEKINHLIVDQESRLKSLSDFKRLLEFYQQLVYLDPSRSLYLLKLAEAQLRLDRFEPARQTLSLILYDPDVSHQARQLLEKIQNQSANAQPATEVALEKHGNHYLVTAAIGSQRVKLMIDTGASMTAIDPEVLTQLNRTAETTGNMRSFSTAGGVIQADIYRLDEFSIGDQAVTDLEIGAIGFRHPIDGVLGMNFLNRYQFFLDQEKKMLRLIPKNP